MALIRSSRIACSLVLALGISVALQLLTGCGVGASLSPSETPLTVSAFQGKVYGGQQPVYGAVIDILAAGTTGYGAGAASILTGSPVKTAQDGSFNINGNFSCPSSDTQIYMTATGGDPSGLDDGSINNTAIKLVAALGPCGNLSTSSFTNLNEVTTVAAAFGLGQFFGSFGTASDFVGAPSTNIVGLKNAFATAHNIANTSTGTVAPTTAAGGTNYFLTVNDQSKINTMANILADCVNQTTALAAQCTSLFSAVTPSHPPLTTTGTATAPTDIFQVAVYMSLNPTSVNSSSSSANMTTLIGMQTAFQPFSPALSAAPTDWTIAVNYSNAGITQLSSAAVDANGDLWFSNQATSTGAFVMLNGGTGTVGGTAGTAGGVIGVYHALNTVAANQPRVVAIDLNGKAWLADNSVDTTDSHYYVLRATGGVGIDAVYQLAGTSQGSLYAVAVDPSDNVIVGTSSDNVVSLSATAVNGASPTITGLAEGSTTVHPGTTWLSINPASVAYAPANAGTTVFEFPTNPVAGFTASPVQSGAQFYGSALDKAGVLWAVDNASKLYTLTGSTFATVTTGGCLSGPKYVAVDGNNNIWVSNATPSDGHVCEFSSTGTLISGTAGFGTHGVVTGRGIAIDQAGNVWVTSYPNSTNSVTEIVGAAVPAVGPLAAAAKNSTIGTRP